MFQTAHRTVLQQYKKYHKILLQIVVANDFHAQVFRKFIIDISHQLPS